MSANIAKALKKSILRHLPKRIVYERLSVHWDFETDSIYVRFDFPGELHWSPNWSPNDDLGRIYIDPKEIASDVDKAGKAIVSGLCEAMKRSPHDGGSLMSPAA